MIKSLILKMIKWLIGLKGLMVIFSIVLAFVADYVLKPDTCEEKINCYVGALGVFYCLYWIIIWFLCPIKRDLMLMKGSAFIWRVILFVILLPFAFTLCILSVNKKHRFHAHELIYAPELVENDTIFISKDFPGFKSSMELISETRKDTILVKFQDVELLETVYEERYKLLKQPSFWAKILHEDVLKIYDAEQDDKLGIIYRKGLAADSISEQQGPSLLWSVYYHFVDPGNQHMTTTDKGRTLALIIALLGVVLMNGLLVSTIINWIDRRKERWTNGEMRYGFCALFLKKYAVVIGACETAPTIIKKLMNGQGEMPNLNYVILLTNGNVAEVRRKVTSYLDDAERKKLIIYSGQLDSIEEIYKLRLKHATEIYVLGENADDKDSFSYHDTQNMKCVHNIASCLADKCVERRVVCRVLFEYQTTYSVFQFSEIPDIIRQRLVFIPFNNYENWAQRVLVTGEYTEVVKKVLPMQRFKDLKPIFLNKILHFIVNSIQGFMPKENEELRKIEYLPLEGKGGIQPKEEESCVSENTKNISQEDEKKDKYVHFVVVGMSKMGIAMAIQAAQVAHYPNFKKDDKNPLRTRITFIDSNADNEMNFFMGRFSNLFDLSRRRYMDATEDNLCLSEIEWKDPMSDSNSPYNHFKSNFIDIEWEFIKGNVELPSVRRYLEMISVDNSDKGSAKSILTIAVCLPLAHEAIAASLYMPASVYDYAQQIWVYQREASDIIYNLYYYEEKNKHKKYKKLRPFGMQYADFTTEKDNYYRAQLCNYVYDLIFTDTINNDAINKKIAEIKDASDKGAMQSAREAWKKLTIFNRWSNRYMANSFETKLRSVGCYLDNYLLHYDNVCAAFAEHSEMLAECEHNRWNVQQLLMGFRALTKEEADEYNKRTDKDEKKNYKGEMKNGREKAHLDICSFEHLGKIEKDVQDYDRIFNHAIPVILKLTEMAKLPKEVKKKM